ncbi:PREDICTED: uncharacterized protein LOC104610257 [Nelumbo nucifera]|uniref:Uncharacterized protein LOC104610257 n=1 Tax=Nelumbo nucifera TaxID=4432 RepID=A0A1U8BF79_NELNU|nr:PREDICTED: uncharacterized protein LOC104610257 [Nelumbo nucifera]
MLTKTVVDNQRDWADKLLETLWAYRTSIRRSTQATPYSLVYGQEVVLPMEIKAISSKVASAMGKKIKPEDLDTLLADKLEVVDEIRDTTSQKQIKYKHTLVNNFNRNLRSRSFKEEDKVLKTALNLRQGKSAGKFAPTWEGPYLIKEVHNSAYYVLKTVGIGEDDEIINGYWLKPYFD